MRPVLEVFRNNREKEGPFERHPLVVSPGATILGPGRSGQPFRRFRVFGGAEECAEGVWAAGKTPRNLVPSVLGRSLVLHSDRLLIGPLALSLMQGVLVCIRESYGIGGRRGGVGR